MWPFLFQIKNRISVNNSRKKGVMFVSIPTGRIYLLLLFFILLLFHIRIFPASAGQIEVIPVTSKEIPSLFVNHQIKGNQVMVECIVTGISFRESDRDLLKTGKIVIWVDDKRKFEAASAAFIIKGLTPGSHKIKLEVVDLQNEPYGLTKQFMVIIPN